MNKVQEIILSYAKLLVHNEEELKIAEIRLGTCVGCEQWKENEIGIHYCDKCGCLTKAKVFSPKGIQACPLSKWKI